MTLPPIPQNTARRSVQQIHRRQRKPRLGMPVSSSRKYGTTYSYLCIIVAQSFATLFLRKLEIGLPGNGFRKWLNIPASAVKKADKESQRNRDECVAAHRGETRSGSSQSMMANAGPLAMVVLVVTTQCAHHRWAWNHIVIFLQHGCITFCCFVLRKLEIGLPGNGFRK